MKSARVLSRAERVRASQRITEQNILPNDVSLALDRREYPGQGERCGKGKSGVDVMRPQTVRREVAWEGGDWASKASAPAEEGSL